MKFFQKTIFIYLVFFILSIEAQENLKFHSLTLTPLSVVSGSNDEISGLNISIDFNLIYQEHQFKFFLAGGSDINLLGSVSDSYTEFDILYGRELSVKKWLSLDLFAGLGILFYNDERSIEHNDKYVIVDVKTQSVGIPIHGRIRFNTGKYFSLGLQENWNFNKRINIRQTGIFFQWRL